MSEQVYFQLRAAIKSGKRPADLIYDFLICGSMEATIVNSKISENKAIIRLITEPEGRKWIRDHLDETLDYIASLAGI